MPRGGPDGGDGGNGGSVIVRAQEGVDSLAALVHRKHWRAKSGVHGMGSNRHGAKADDLLILVPPGTVVRDEQHDLLLKDLSAAATRLSPRGAARGARATRVSRVLRIRPRVNSPAAKRASNATWSSS